MSERVNLLDFDRASLTAFLATHGEKSFRATQILQWVHHHGVDNMEAMTNLSKALRQKLADLTYITLPTVLTEQQSADGTHKWVLRLADGNAVETVFIPEDDRGTLCVSSQVGCALNCAFCSTGHQGFNRNLTVAEIIGQVWIAVRRLSKQQKMHDRHVTNVVMMGMGEPLLNFDPVVKALSIMRDDFGYGLSKRRVTLSTSGVVPLLEKLKQVSDVSLAVSLHAPTDELRDILVPVNKKYPLSELLRVCKDYFPPESRRKITFEYVMLDGVNDQPVHARQLIQLLRDIPAKMNLIPFNPFPQTVYRRSPPAVIQRFSEILQKADLITTTRKTRGDDIDAACGQLVGKVFDKTRRQKQYKIDTIAIETIGDSARE